MLNILFHYFIEPRSTTEDQRRREFILNILLSSSVVLVGIALARVIGNSLVLGSNYKGTSWPIMAVIFLVFLGLYVLSRIRFSVAAANMLIVLYYLTSTFALYRYGTLLHIALLIYALVIIMAGILISTRAAFFVTIILSLTLIVLTIMQANGTLVPDIYWASELGGLGDALVFIVTLSIMLLISWLSNREIERSFQRARRSEAALKKERDLLEIKVEERTHELKRAQMEEINRLYRFSELGQMTAGLIHDLVNPLTTLSLNLEELQGHEQSNVLRRAERDPKPENADCLCASGRDRAVNSRSLRQSEARRCGHNLYR
jgi:signal transduction histidine kinase